MARTYQTIESDSQLCHSLQKIILDNLDSDERRHGPLKRQILRWNSWRFQMVMSKFLGFDLTRKIDIDNDNQLTLAERWHRYKKQKAAPKFYLSVIGLLIFCTLSNWINLYFQYTYDINLSLLREINSRAETSSKNTSVMAETARNEAKEARVWLKFLGSAHLEWHFVEQMTFLYFWSYAIVYIMGSIYVRIFDLDHFSWFRWLLNAEGESESRARLTLAEMARIQRTMILSAEVEFDKLQDAASAVSDSVRFDPNSDGPHFKDAPGRCGSGRSSSYVLGQIESRRELMDRTRWRTSEQLRRVALAGRLNPLNRTLNSLGNLETGMLLSDLAQYTAFVSFLFYLYYAFKYLFARGGSHVEFVGYRDYIQALNFFYPILLCYIVCIPVTTFNLVTGYDLAQSMVKLKSLMLRTIESNEIIFRKIVAASTRSLGASKEKLEALTDELEGNLLVTAIQYRLFANEHSLSLRYFRYFGVIYLSLVLSVPVLARSHGAYISNELKPFFIVVALIFLEPTFLSFLPYCSLHQKCVETFKLLNSITAQLIEYSSIRPLEDCPTIQQIRSLFARELSEPQRALRKFSFRILRLDITYATMLRLIFWALLVQMPTLSRSKSDGIMGEFLDDPLGIFKQLE